MMMEAFPRVENLVSRNDTVEIRCRQRGVCADGAGQRCFATAPDDSVSACRIAILIMKTVRAIASWSKRLRPQTGLPPARRYADIACAGPVRNTGLSSMSVRFLSLPVNYHMSYIRSKISIAVLDDKMSLC
jgi:hypothetical protein